MNEIDHAAFVRLVREQLPAIASWHADWGRLDLFRFVRFTHDAVARGDWDTVRKAFALADTAFERGAPKLRSGIFYRLLGELKLDGPHGEAARALLSTELSRALDAWLARRGDTELAIVAVYQQPTQYFLHPSHGGQVNFWRAGPPSMAMPLDTSDAKLGEAVLYLLTECRPAAQSPEPSRAESVALLKPARVQSWMALQRTAKLVDVVRTERSLRVEPTRNGGNRGDDGGFHFLGDRAEMLGPDSAPAMVGVSVRRAFGWSTPPPQSA